MLNKELLYEAVMNKMSSFYKDYLVDDSLLKTLTMSYMHSMDMLVNYTNDTLSNILLKTAETTRVFPYTSFNANNSVYTLTRIARTPNITFYLGVPSSYTEREIIDYWRNSASPIVKTEILKMMGIYTELLSGDYVRALSEGESEHRYKGNILNADIYHNGEVKKDAIDCIIKDNKFYILNTEEFDMDNPYITLKNIVLDYNMSWLRTGSYLDIRYSDVVGKLEYNNLNKLFLQIASKGPVVADIRDSIKEMFPDDKVQLFDYYTKNNEKNYYWDASITPPEAYEGEQIRRAITNTFNAGELLAGQGLDNPDDNIDKEGKGLSIYDFVLCMPTTIIHPGIDNEDSKIEMFKRYLNVIKPADSNYYISWIEDVDNSDGSNTVKPSDIQELTTNSTDDVLDSIGCTDDQDCTNKEYSQLKLGSQYAKRFDYSSGVLGDDSCLLWDNEDCVMDEISNAELIEHCSLYLHTFPEAPIGLSAIYIDGVIRISFQNTGIGASYYEVYRNDTLINKISIDSTDRNKRISIDDKRFQNIKTDKYSIRTVFIEMDKSIEEAQYSHFSVVSATC